MPTAPATEQFLHDYYETYRDKSFKDVPYEEFAARVAQESRKNPKFINRMSDQLVQTNLNAGNVIGAPPEKFLRGYFDVYHDRSFPDVGYEEFTGRVTKSVQEDSTFTKRMSDQLFTLYRHKMDREEFETTYGLRAGTKGTSVGDVVSEGWQAFTRSLTEQNVSMMGKSIYTIGKFAGSEEVAQAGSTIAETAEGFDIGKEPEVGDWRQVQSAGDFFKWAAGLTGSGLGSIAPVLGGIVGGGAAAGPVGAVLGGITASGLLNIGESYDFFKAEGVPEEQAVRDAIFSAPAVVALDYASAMSLIGKSHLSKPVKSGLLRIYKGMQSGALKEGATETLQDGIRQAIAVAETGDVDAQRRAGDLLNSLAGGVFVGGGVSGAQQTYREARGQSEVEPPPKPEPEEGPGKEPKREPPPGPEPEPEPEPEETYDPTQDEEVAEEKVVVEEEGVVEEEDVEPPTTGEETYVPSLQSYVLAAETKSGQRKRMDRKAVEKGSVVVVDRAGDEEPFTGTIEMVEEDGSFVVKKDDGESVPVKPDEPVSLYTETDEESKARVDATPEPD